MSFFRKESEEHTLVLDVRSDSVGHILFSCSEGKPRILATGRLYFGIDTKIDAKRYLSRFTSGIKKLVPTIAKELPVRPDKVVCVLGTPWFRAGTRNITYKNEDGFTYSRKFSDELIEEEVDAFCEETGMAGHCQVLEINPLSIHLNGYATASPFGKDAQRAELKLYLSLADIELVKALESSVHHSFHADEITYLTFPYVASKIVPRVANIAQNQFMVADINAEVTEISIIKNNTLVHIASFPTGTHMLYRELSTALGVSADQAVQLYQATVEGRTGKNIQASLERAVEISQRQWKESMLRCLKKASENFLLPSVLVVMGTQSNRFISKDLLDTLSINESTSQGTNLDIVELNAEDLLQYLVPDGGVSKNDAFLSIETLYYCLLKADTVQ